MENKKAIVLIPAYNEINNLPKLIRKLKQYNILIINDSSSDGTEKFLKKNKINFLSTKKRMGQTNSLILGFKHIIKKYEKTKYIITFDADGEHKVSDLKKFFNKIKLNPDLVMGSRNRKNRFIENIISVIFNYKFKIKDPMTGFKMIKTKIIKDNFKHLNDKYFLIDFLKKISSNISVLNLKIDSPPRSGKSKHNQFFTNFKMLKTLIFILI